MQGDFQLEKLGYYTVVSFESNSFLNSKLTSDQYGSWFSVKFEGNAEPILWQTKSEPTVGEKYWGMLTKTSSGKAVKFKWDKQNAPTSGQTPSDSPKAADKAFLKDVSNTPIQIYNGSLNYAKEAGLNLIADKADRELYLEYVKDISDELLKWVDNIRGGAITKEKVDEVFNTDEMPLDFLKDES